VTVFVVDASVALKWVIPEVGAEAALALRAADRLIAPDLIVAECANALWKMVSRGEMSPEETTWEATRLNIILANKGYSDSDVTRWWNFTRHRELDDQTVGEAWKAGDGAAISNEAEIHVEALEPSEILLFDLA